MERIDHLEMLAIDRAKCGEANNTLADEQVPAILAATQNLSPSGLTEEQAQAVAKHSFWKLDREDPQYVRFRAADWDEFPSSNTGTSWAPQSNALILFELTFDDEIPYLNLALSPSDPSNTDIRELLFDAARQNPTVFKPYDNSLIDGWMILHLEPDCILEEADYGLG